MKKVLCSIMGAMLLLTSMVSCNSNTEVSTERKMELCEKYITEHNWTGRYDTFVFEDSVKSDEYFFIKIYAYGLDYPTVIGTVYYE